MFSELLSSCQAGWNAALDFFLPRFCLLCQTPLPPAEPGLVCGACLGQLPLLSQPQCLCCGAPFRSPQGGDHLCQACLRQPPPYDRARAAAFYDGMVLEAIRRLKYQRQLLFARFLGEILRWSAVINEVITEAQLILPVPLHPRRLRGRGFNQALLLAQQWGKLPVVPDVFPGTPGQCQRRLCRQEPGQRGRQTCRYP